MNSEDGQIYSVCILLFSTVCSQNINKHNMNIADETLTDYSFLSRYHYTKKRIIYNDDIEFPCLLGHPVFKKTISNSHVYWDTLYIQRTQRICIVLRWIYWSMLVAPFPPKKITNKTVIF